MTETQRPTRQQIDTMSDDEFVHHAEKCIDEGRFPTKDLKRLSRILRDAFYAEARRFLAFRQ